MYSVDLCFNLDSHSNVGQTVGRPGKKCIQREMLSKYGPRVYLLLVYFGG